MARQKDRLNVYLSAGTIGVWRYVAAEMGLVARGGTQKGQGSVSGLMEALARPGFDFSRLEELFGAGLDIGPTN